MHVSSFFSSPRVCARSLLCLWLRSTPSVHVESLSVSLVMIFSLSSINRCDNFFIFPLALPSGTSDQRYVDDSNQPRAMQVRCSFYFLLIMDRVMFVDDVFNRQDNTFSSHELFPTFIFFVLLHSRCIKRNNLISQKEQNNSSIFVCVTVSPVSLAIYSSRLSAHSYQYSIICEYFKTCLHFSWLISKVTVLRSNLSSENRNFCRFRWQDLVSSNPWT